MAGVALDQFRQHGGLVSDNPDGWGIAWWADKSFRVVKEPLPAHESKQFASLCETTYSNIIIAHVRKAKFPPSRAMINTHPFQQICCGRHWVFAHNGLVPDIVEMEQANDNPICWPNGETDSEYAFCHLLSHIARYFHAHCSSGITGTVGSFPTLATISELIASHGKFNFLMSDGEYLMAYGHDRLHYLEQNRLDSMNQSLTSKVLIATEPLQGDEDWAPFEAGELRIYRSGSLAGQILTRPFSQPK
ncbi:MAG: class II glutamine amidotransferase [Burkholderiales bacterium]|nr:class II glutamine amidotransferase [Burkholderiales bacterium]